MGGGYCAFASAMASYLSCGVTYAWYINSALPLCVRLWLLL